MEQARQRGIAGPDDDLLITSGCQQAFDLLQRVLASHGETVLLEDPVYPGLRNVFLRGGARVAGVPVGEHGIDLEALARTIEKEHPRLIVLTPNFQNPTGTTIPEVSRRTLLAMARRAGVVVVENDLYGDLRYRGAEIPAFKNWISPATPSCCPAFRRSRFRACASAGPSGRATSSRALRKPSSPAICTRISSRRRCCCASLFPAAWPRIAQKMLARGRERLDATLAACAAELPAGSHFTRPEGGMNVWVRLPEPLDAADMAARADREGVSFLPGRHFAVSRPQTPGGCA